MQFPVPQFTDVEDKIIGSLTFKQFGIIFAAGILVFLFYTATKSIAVLILVALFVGIPALALAFGKINGRPMYNAIGFFLKFLSSPKVLVFHKEVNSLPARTKLKDAGVAKAVVRAEKIAETPQERLRKVNELLKQKEQEERELVKGI